MHALVTRGGWTSGQWVPVPYVDPACAEQLFRHKLICLLQRAGLLDEDRTRLLLSWPHSGFSVHNSVTVPAGDYHALEALARYCGATTSVSTACGLHPGQAPSRSVNGAATTSPQRPSMHWTSWPACWPTSPNPRRHLVHYYGAYFYYQAGPMIVPAAGTAPLAPQNLRIATP